MKAIPETHPMHHKNRPLLNPDWVELLMGFPLGWTKLDGLLLEGLSSFHTSRRERSTKPK
jgi:hypothetical protein